MLPFPQKRSNLIPLFKISPIMNIDRKVLKGETNASTRKSKTY